MVEVLPLNIKDAEIFALSCSKFATPGIFVLHDIKREISEIIVYKFVRKL